MIYPKISIVTPSLNQGQFIEETILSVLNQNYPNLEYIIIDGGSTDNTLEIIKKYEKQLTYWISEPDKGQSDAINKGLKLMTGDIFNWINSDDYYTPNALHIIANWFINNEQIEVVTGFEKDFQEDNSQDFIIKGGSTVCKKIENSILKAHIRQPTTFFRAKVLKNMGLLSTDYHYLFDGEWWLKYLFINGQNNILEIPEIIANFRLHKTSKTVTQQDLFWEERKLLNYSVAKYAGTPEYVLKEIRKELYFSNIPEFYIQKANLNQSINLNFFIGFYCEKYYGPLYLNKEYPQSRQALLKYLRFGKIKWSINLIKVIIKLFIIPRFLLNILNLH